MIFVLSPAKTLDYERALPRGVRQRATEPLFLTQAAGLIERLQSLAAEQVAQLMALSDDLAALNVARYAQWLSVHDDGNSRPAVLAFNGDVYAGLDARSLKGADLGWAQEHLVILSGLYGALRPFDRLQPYRLEMGTALDTTRGRDLYAYWGDTVATYLNHRLAGERQPLIVNLASQEYFKALRRPALGVPVLECRFEDWHAPTGRYKVISFFAKRARGLMARFAVQHRVRSLDALKRFDAEGYAFEAAASSADQLVFRRRAVD